MSDADFGPGRLKVIYAVFLKRILICITTVNHKDCPKCKWNNQTMRKYNSKGTNGMWKCSNPNIDCDQLFGWTVSSTTSSSEGEASA